LSGLVRRPDGTAVEGPTVRFKGRRHGPRQDRRWAKAWSPEQIAKRLPLEFPGDETMRISHEAIYQSLFVQGRGALKRELVTCLRSGRALRVPRARAKGRGKNFITPEVMISERPAEAADRAVPGHWEGDLIIGLDKSAIGTLVERTTRYTMLLHLPPMEGHGRAVKVKNGPPLAGHGAEAVRDAIARTITTLPEHLRRSLTWDQGTEMASHAKLTIDTGLAVYFANPHSPWLTGQSGPRMLRGRSKGFAQLLARRRRRARISSSWRRTLAATASRPWRRWSISTTRPDKVCASRLSMRCSSTTARSSGRR
ncbi:MAG: IS30 family transposase, partial [Acidimicrobiales bacterium]